MAEKTPDFIQFFVEMRNGGVAVAASQHLQGLVKAVAESGKPGKLSLTITLKPATIHKGEVKEIEASADFKVTEPKLDPGKTIFFPYKGGLTRHDPAQMEMFEAAQQRTERRTTE